MGDPPFIAEDQKQIFDKILNRDILWPKVTDDFQSKIDEITMSTDAYELINSLLTLNPKERLGNKSIIDIKSSKFFEGIFIC